MIMRKLLPGLVAIALVVGGCSKNEVLNRGGASAADSKIKFSAVNTPGTRAAAGHPMHSTADLRQLGKFSVIGYGSYNSSDTELRGYDYLKRQTVSYNGGSWEYSNEPFWPAGTLDFMAYAPVRAVGDENKDYLGADFIAAPKMPVMGTFANAVSSTMTFTDFTVQPATGATNEQIDFVVAAAPDQSKTARTSLLFKHALTQVVFSANVKENTANPLGVTISGLSIHNISGKGTLVVPRSGNLSTAWTASADEADMQIFTADPSSAIPVTAIAGDIPPYNRIRTANDRNELLMIPQHFERWDALETIAENDALGGFNGAYVKISATITTKVDPDGIPGNGDDNEIYLLGSATVPGTLYIPLASQADVDGEWTPGKRINYIITFGDQDSASGGGGYDENGDPVLVPIRFTAALENWVEMDVPLLTAEISGTTTQLTQSVIEQYNNLILGDIYNAPYPKSYNAKVTFTSTVEAASNITIPNANFGQWFMASQFMPGSTFTLDFSGAAFAGSSPKTISITPPAGWEAAVGATGTTATTFGSGMVTVDGSATRKVIVLKKMPVKAADYLLLLRYYDQATDAIVANMNGLTLSSDCDYAVLMPTMALLDRDVIIHSAPIPAVNANINAGSSIYYECDITDWNGKTVRMTIPAGWEGWIGNTLIPAGDDAILNGSESTTGITLTKL